MIHSSETGQGLLEYGLTLVLVAVAVVAILVLLGPQIGEIFSTITTCVPPTAQCPYYQ
ncbi:MAG: pilus assembly protein [Anaerolineae bacterium]|nr:pilus assembly protein [Anaerolineae bacterium]